MKTGVEIAGLEHIEYLPIMDYKNKSINIVLKVNADDKTRIEAEQSENAVRWYQTDMEASEEKGRKEGKIEVAKSSLKIGLDYETISAITDLSIEEIEKLR